MKFSAFRTAYLALAAFLLNACGYQQSQNSARLMHNWSEVSRGEIPKSKPVCKVDRSLAAKRLNLIASAIAAGNPETFKGNLDISQICIQIDHTDTQQSAKTTPSQKNILFSLKILASAQSDRQLAAIVAHELAHITLQHAGMGETAPRVLKTPEGTSIAEQQKQIQNKIRDLTNAGAPASEILELTAAFGKTVEQMNSLTDKIYAEANAHLNWAEQEADEVGSEFFVRAGYPIHEFANMLWLSSKQNPQQIMECNNLIYAAWENSTVRPERGNADHPSTCWRAFHLLVDEYGPTGEHKDQAATCPHRPVQ